LAAEYTVVALAEPVNFWIFTCAAFSLLESEYTFCWLPFTYSKGKNFEFLKERKKKKGKKLRNLLKDFVKDISGDFIQVCKSVEGLKNRLSGLKVGIDHCERERKKLVLCERKWKKKKRNNEEKKKLFLFKRQLFLQQLVLSISNIK